MVNPELELGAGNIEAIRCARMLKEFFRRLDSLRRLIFHDKILLPRSYRGAYMQVRLILNDLIKILKPKKAFLHVDARAAAIFRFEGDILIRYTRRIRSNSRKLIDWLKLALKSANILIGTLQTIFPPIIYIHEFKGQLENIMSEVEARRDNPMIASRAQVKVVPRPKGSKLKIVR